MPSLQLNSNSVFLPHGTQLQPVVSENLASQLIQPGSLATAGMGAMSSPQQLQQPNAINVIPNMISSNTMNSAPANFQQITSARGGGNPAAAAAATTATAAGGPGPIMFPSGHVVGVMMPSPMQQQAQAVSQHLQNASTNATSAAQTSPLFFIGPDLQINRNIRSNAGKKDREGVSSVHIFISLF